MTNAVVKQKSGLKNIRQNTESQPSEMALWECESGPCTGGTVVRLTIHLCLAVDMHRRQRLFTMVDHNVTAEAIKPNTGSTIGPESSRSALRPSHL